MSSDLPPLPAGVPRTSRHRVANALNSTAILALRAARVADAETGLTALEEAGLVRREEVPADRRQSLVSATAAGRRVLEAGRRARIERLAAVLDDVRPEQLGELDRAFTVVRKALRSSRQRG
jgi:DNA-binding MarR family transcriptional regulator